MGLHQHSHLCHRPCLITRFSNKPQSTSSLSRGRLSRFASCPRCHLQCNRYNLHTIVCTFYTFPTPRRQNLAFRKIPSLPKPFFTIVYCDYSNAVTLELNHLFLGRFRHRRVPPPLVQAERKTRKVKIVARLTKAKKMAFLSLLTPILVLLPWH